MLGVGVRRGTAWDGGGAEEEGKLDCEGGAGKRQTTSLQQYNWVNTYSVGYGLDKVP